jgi:spore coat protein H
MRAIGAMFVVAACGLEQTIRPAADDSTAPVVDSEGDPSVDDSDPPPPPSPTTVRIVELLSDPADTGTDWLELWNDGDAAIDLAGWSIQDRSGSLSSLSGEILAGERRVIGSSELGFTLDNDGGSLALRVGNAVVQSFAFGPLLPGMSLAYTEEGWGLDRAPTPGGPPQTAFRGAPTATVACGPSLVADPPQPQEGETIGFEVVCSKGTAAGRGATIFGSSIPANDGQLSWTPSLSDAGRHPLLAATWTIDPDVPPETAILDLDVADAWSDPKNVPVDPIAYEEEWGLPVLHLFPEGTLGADYVPASATFQGHTYTMEAKYRGAASYGYPQNSFTLRFEEEDSIDLGDWDMGHRDHLVLITTFDDNSHVRQKLVYDLWRGLAEDAGADRMVPRTFFVALYLDGEYFGLYTAIDHVDDEFARDMGLAGDGNMYKAVDHNANFYRQSASGGVKATLHDGYEKKEGEPESDFSDLEALVAFSADSDEDTFRAEAPAWIRVDEFADWFLLVLYTSAYDSAGKNSYLYDDSPGSDIEFRFTPWDMNDALGQDWRTYRADASASTAYWMSMNGIFRHLLTHPDSAAEIAARADHLLNAGTFELGAVQARVDELQASLGRSSDRTWEKWGDQYRAYGSWDDRDDFTSPAEEVAYVRAWLAAHDDAVRAIWGL